MRKPIGVVLGVVALAITGLNATQTRGEDDFPLIGSYTENQVCKGDSSDANVSRVKIAAKEIDSSVFGLCTIIDKKRDGKKFAIHVECKGPGGSVMVGDINFTMRDDGTVEFADQDNTYKAVLYKCPG